MNRQAAVALVVLSAALMCGSHTAEAQLRGRNYGPGEVFETQPPVAAPPVAVIAQPIPLAPAGNSPSLVVISPPAVRAEPTVDAGDSNCLCPDGQTADVQGWCWRRTDAASGHWARMDKCQR
jgi:hypothetical protein